MKLITFCVLAILTYLAYQRFAPPTEITNPVYAEVRITMDISGRKIEAAIFGKMMDYDDCEERANRVRYLMESKCPYCVSKSLACKDNLDDRYLQFFDNAPANATYLSIDRATAGERDVREIIWGLTHSEGNQVCEDMKRIFAEIHHGPMQCVAGLTSS